VANYFDSDDAAQRLRGNLDGLYKLPAESDDLAEDITTAEATVDSHVGKRYAVPVTDTTAVTILKALSLALFEELAWRRGAGDEIPKKVADAAAQARTDLAAIATGAITLAGATALTERPSGGAEAIIVEANDPEFTRDDMSGF